MSKQFCQHLTARVMPHNTTQREVSKSRIRWGSLRPWKRLTSCWPLLPDFTQLPVRVCSPTDVHGNYFHSCWSGCCDVGLTCGSVQNMGSADNGSDYGVPYSRWPWIKGLLRVCESESRSVKTPLVLSGWKAAGGGGGGDRGGSRARPSRTGPWGVCVCRDFRPVWGLHAIETSQTSTTGERSG